MFANASLIYNKFFFSKNQSRNSYVKSSKLRIAVDILNDVYALIKDAVLISEEYKLFRELATLNREITLKKQEIAEKYMNSSGEDDEFIIEALTDFLSDYEEKLNLVTGRKNGLYK
ncbi:MAG: hypothetical protein PHR06_10055 [Candidatus Cloacimonetes bacterium]|nr:hypothetical protein [Candidatus Cloacimonadota bacterium]